MRTRNDEERNRWQSDRYPDRDIDSRGDYAARPSRYSQPQTPYGAGRDDARGEGDWEPHRRSTAGIWPAGDQDEAFRDYRDYDDRFGYAREGRGERYGESSFGRGTERSGAQGEYGGGRYQPRAFESGGTSYRPSGYDDFDRGRQRQSWQPVGSLGYGPPRGETGQYARGDGRAGETSVGNGRAGRHAGKGPKGYIRSDERIREEISDRLTTDDDIDASEIEITVTNGDVVLRGTVDTRESKRAAEDLAESVQGVRDVQNQLRVDNGDARSSQNGKDRETSPTSGRTSSSTAASRAKGDHETAEGRTTGGTR
jgi:hypothetical protein